MTDIAPVAARVRSRFSPGVNAVVRDGRTVHAVRLSHWVEGEEVPELACHTGVAGWSPNALQPTMADVTCARCLRDFGPEEIRPNQLALFGRDVAKEC